MIASTNKMEIKMKINQIVKGEVCGTFVILGFRNIDGQEYAQVKAVNPNDHTQTAKGELALPVESLRTI